MKRNHLLLGLLIAALASGCVESQRPSEKPQAQTQEMVTVYNEIRTISWREFRSDTTAPTKIESLPNCFSWVGTGWTLCQGDAWRGQGREPHTLLGKAPLHWHLARRLQ